MPPRRREPWWHANVGLLATLALTACGGFVVVKTQLAALERAVQDRPELVERRNRELDQRQAAAAREMDALRADLRELRVLVNEHCR